MKLIEILKQDTLNLSFEVFPPKTDSAFEGVKAAVEKDGILGVITGGLAAASAGITASLLFAFLWSLIFKSKQK